VEHDDPDGLPPARALAAGRLGAISSEAGAEVQRLPITHDLDETRPRSLHLHGRGPRPAGKATLAKLLVEDRHVLRGLADSALPEAAVAASAAAAASASAAAAASADADTAAERH
jgi:hypothetical protein